MDWISIQSDTRCNRLDSYLSTRKDDATYFNCGGICLRLNQWHDGLGLYFVTLENPLVGGTVQVHSCSIEPLIIEVPWPN
jgi:hypothetical protein